MSVPMNPHSSPDPEDALARRSDVTVSRATSLHAEYRGFFIYVLSGVALYTWIAWALLPDTVLRDWLAITYFPDTYWALAIPAYLLMWMLYAYVALSLYATEVLTPPLHDLRCFVDEHTVYPLPLLDVDWAHTATAGVKDLPVSLVNEVLYL